MGLFCSLVLLGIAAPLLPTAAAGPGFHIEGDMLHIEHGGGRLDISLRSPMLFFVDVERGVGGLNPVGILGDVSAGDEVVLEYAPVEVGERGLLNMRLLLRWSIQEQVLRKRVLVKVVDAPAPLVLEEVLLDVLDAGTLLEEPRFAPPRSMPVFLPGFFIGIEFPVASVRVEDARLLVGHGPQVTLSTGETFESRSAVYGLAAAGQERTALHRYINAHRPAPRGLHFNYNSWWTSPVPFSEQNILEIMAVFEKNCTGHMECAG